MLADGAPDEKIKPLAEKVTKKCSGCVFDKLVEYFKFDMAREMIENGYDISKSSYLLSDMVEDDRHYTNTEFTRAVFVLKTGLMSMERLFVVLRFFMLLYGRT